MSDYTPTTEEVCEDFATRMAPHLDDKRRAGFKRWHAAEIRKAEAWLEGAAEAWRESGIRTYGKAYEDLPDSRFIPLSLRQLNPYTEES